MRPVVSPKARHGAAGAAGAAEPGADEGAAAAYTAPALEKGLDILELLAGASEGLTQTAIAQRLMQELAAATRQSNHLVIHFARRILVVAQVDSPEPMGFAVRLGAHFPFRPDRASSRVLSAFQPKDAQHELIAELLANSTRALSAARVKRE